jgi:hypothetical protein
LERVEGVSYWAWALSAEKIKSSNPSPFDIEILAGPNTKLTTKNTKQAIENVAKLYFGEIAPKRVVVIYFSQADIPWGQTTFNRFAVRPEGNETAQMCLTANTCWGARAEVDYNGTGIVLAAVRDISIADVNQTSGTMEAHEFAHNFQAVQFAGTPKQQNTYCCIKQYVPWWLVEGSATFVQAAAVYPDLFADYSLEIKRLSGDLRGVNRSIHTKEWFEKFLQPASTSEWGKSDYQWKIYSVGALVEEIFVALKGPEINMKVLRDVATGSTWPEAFEKNFGLHEKSASQRRWKI